MDYWFLITLSLSSHAVDSLVNTPPTEQVSSYKTDFH